jgi:hypothetical protein
LNQYSNYVQKHVKICANENAEAIIASLPDREIVMTIVDDAKVSPSITRIDWRSPAWQLLLSLFLPVGLAIGLDLMMATLPLATMSISLICIPLATVLVTRSILAEFDKVIETVAPQPIAGDAAIEDDRKPGDMQPDASA